MMRLAAVALASILLLPAARAQEKSRAEERFLDLAEETARRLELRESDETPAWAAREEPPLFRFAQIADIHLTPARADLLRAALRYLSEEVRPDFVVLTGDSTSVYTIEGHRTLKAILDEGLSVPYFAVRGDNDSRHFPDVFGSTRWSFDWGGVHFVGCGLDRDVERLGIGTFEPDTWEWLDEDLKRAAGRPTFYFQHEPCLPPTFLDAPRLALLLSLSPDVVAVVNGHLHHDLEFRFGKPHISALALGPSEHHGLKVYSVYRDGALAQSHYGSGEAFRAARVFQRIPFPSRLALEGDEPRERTGYRELPARAPIYDPELERRVEEVRELLRRFGG